MFFPLSARWAFFSFIQKRREGKNDPLADGEQTTKGEDEAQGMGATSAKHASPFGAPSALYRQGRSVAERTASPAEVRR